MVKKSDKEIQREVDKRLKEIAQARKKAKDKGLRSAFLSKDQLIKKIRGDTANSPYFVGSTWSSGQIGGQASFDALVSNPDPGVHLYLLMTIFFGMPDFVDITQALLGRSEQWPCMSTSPFRVEAGQSTTQYLTYPIPTGIPPATYLGHVVLWEIHWVGTGVYFDRICFDVSAYN